MKKTDGHVHTPFCPHGTMDKFEEYIDQALNLGFEAITFTEHAPLPKGFIDPTPLQDSAMKLEDLEEYIISIQRLKHTYKNKLDIHIGLEVDYIKEFEKETTALLTTYGKHLDDSILSVHFLKLSDTYYCMDYDHHVFDEMIRVTGSLQNLHEEYYKQVLNSIKSDLGAFKPKRIGHLTLSHKFQKLFPVSFSSDHMISEILTAIKQEQLEIDFNVAGLRKEYCKETYPNSLIASTAIKQKIPLVYGSDAHIAGDVGKNYSKFQGLWDHN
ncbi:histidinol-phosphatase HisJ [Metabacillus sp. HB246100]